MYQSETTRNLGLFHQCVINPNTGSTLNYCVNYIYDNSINKYVKYVGLNAKYVQKNSYTVEFDVDFLNEELNKNVVFITYNSVSNTYVKLNGVATYRALGPTIKTKDDKYFHLFPTKEYLKLSNFIFCNAQLVLNGFSWLYDNIDKLYISHSRNDSYSATSYRMNENFYLTIDIISKTQYNF